VAHKTLQIREGIEDNKNVREKENREKTINGSWLPTANTFTLASSPPVAKTRPDFGPNLRQLIACSLEDPSSGIEKRKKDFFFPTVFFFFPSKRKC